MTNTNYEVLTVAEVKAEGVDKFKWQDPDAGGWRPCVPSFVADFNDDYLLVVRRKPEPRFYASNDGRVYDRHTEYMVAAFRKHPLESDTEAAEAYADFLNECEKQ